MIVYTFIAIINLPIMKNLKIYISISLLLICSLYSFAQDNASKSNIAFDRGLNMYNAKNYKEAETLFKKSINNYPQSKAFYYLALTGLHLNDSCEPCTNLMKAQQYGNKDAYKLFDSVCYKRIRINYNEASTSEFIFFLETKSEVCSNHTFRSMSVKNLKNGIVSSFDIPGYDTTAMWDKNFFIKHPGFKDLTSDSIIFIIPENMPEYIGGDEARIRFLTNNLRYSQADVAERVQGTVFISFIIDKDGSTSNVKLLRGIGGDCDKEALRVVRLMPKWKPGIFNNKPVRVQFNMPLKFTLN